VTSFRVGLKTLRPDGTTFPPAGFEIVSDASGRFRVENVDPGTYVVEARAAGFAPSTSAPIEVTRGHEPAFAEIAMSQGGTVTGTVVGSDGVPVEGADVELTANNYVAGPVDGLFAALSGASNEPKLLSTTDGQGKFVLTNIVEGTFQVRVSAEGHAPTARNDVESIADQTHDVGTIRLDAGGRIAGVCLDREGRPLDGLVNCRNANGALLATKPDIDGTFEFKELAAGDYTVSIQSAAVGANPFTAMLDAQQTSLPVTVKAGATTNVTLQLPRRP